MAKSDLQFLATTDVLSVVILPGPDYYINGITIRELVCFLLWASLWNSRAQGPSIRIQMHYILSIPELSEQFISKAKISGLPSDMDLYKLQLNNFTEVTMFILMSFTEEFDVRVFLFLLFLAIYLFTLIGNLGLVVLVIGDFRLHNPMYYFLGVLSFLDACYSTVFTPKMLVNFLAKNKSISFLGCVAQMFLACAFGTTECFLLAAMAYDRYVAIYNPLLYSVSMSPRVYVPLITASYVVGILHATIHTVATFRLSFCGSNEIRHVFCNMLPLLAISCSDTHTNQLLLFYFVGSIEIVTILIVLISYGLILLAILKMHSAEGRRKVFSTCGAHLTGVTIYHGTILFVYVRPSSSYASDNDMIVSIFYTIVIPMLNPIIYSLRNKDVKEAIKRLLVRNWFIRKL
ncbi:olfactory receptor 5T1 [Symphalangus syndactylus]|uniref:olfactory receptor 5T1 n=1 Tax=Symphalangus syndactylus TaxID=9590 RepID=UPI002441605B|nr:olfactory receptor 5T1 [Symphalangus syndactylus]